MLFVTGLCGSVAACSITAVTPVCSWGCSYRCTCVKSRGSSRCDAVHLQKLLWSTPSDNVEAETSRPFGEPSVDGVTTQQAGLFCEIWDCQEKESVRWEIVDNREVSRLNMTHNNRSITSRLTYAWSRTPSLCSAHEDPPSFSSLSRDWHIETRHHYMHQLLPLYIHPLCSKWSLWKHWETKCYVNLCSLWETQEINKEVTWPWHWLCHPQSDRHSRPHKKDWLLLTSANFWKCVAPPHGSIIHPKTVINDVPWI